MGQFSRSLALLWVATTTWVACEKAPLVLDISQDVAALERRRLMRRDGPVTTEAVDAQDSLYVDVAIGNPAQTIRMQPTTNYGDIIILSEIDPICANSNCFWSATYDANSSSSYRYLDESFDLYITLWSGDSYPLATGDVATETLQLGRQDLDNVTVLVATNGTLNTAKFGIGYTNIEATTNRYANLPVQLYNENRTNIIGYSMYFDHRNSTKPGRITFGGIDTGKFYGTLATMPIIMSDREYRDTQINYSNITVWDGTSNTTVASTPATAIVDANTEQLVLPSSAFQQLVTKLNATYNSSSGDCTVLLDQMNNDTTVNIGFGSMTIEVPMIDMWWDSNATHAWLLLSDAGSGRVALGMPFIRNAYLVFDLSHNQISLAPFRGASTTDNITLIDQAGAAGVVGYVGSPDTDGNNGSNSTDTGPSTPSNSDSSSGLSTGAKAGIGVGVAGGVLLIGALAGFFAWRHRRNKKTAAQAASASTDSSSDSQKPPLPPAGPALAHQYHKDTAELSSPTHDVKHSNFADVRELEAAQQPKSPVSELFASPVSPDGQERIARKPIPPVELE